MSKWSFVGVLVLLVLTSAIGVQALANTTGPMPPSPWLSANTTGPMPPSPWMNTTGPMPPSPWMNTTGPMPPSPWQ
jgi:hypothetical protein